MGLLLKFFDFIGLASSKSASSKKCIPANILDEAIEHIVDGIEPKMRYVSGYKKIIRKGVVTSLSYISELVDTIPGPVFVSGKTFATDPQVNAYFATVSDVQAVFSESEELRDFFEATENSGLEEAYTLMCVSETEKTVLGMDLHKDIIRREVVQTALNISDHKILSPAKNEIEVRAGIKRCIFDGLITHALQKIIEIKQQKQGLEIQSSVLNSRLKRRQSQGGGLSNLLASATENIPSNEIENKISENNRQLEKIPASWEAPRYYLEIIKDTLEQPESFVSLNKKYFNLTKMGIVSNDDSSQSANTICFDEILIANVLKRVVAIVRYPRAEMLPKQTFNLNQ